MATQTEQPPPLEESSAFHQLRAVSGDDSPLVRVLLEMNRRMDGMDRKLDLILEKLDA